jgi:peptide/nickel transport system permease protein
MAQYVIRRLLLAVPTLLLVVAIVFLSMRILPTDIADLIVDNAGVGGSAYTKTAIRQQLNLDKPVLVQLGLYVGNLARGDMGHSAYDRKPVLKKVGTAFPITLELTIIAMVLSTVAAIVIGVLSAVKQDTPLDYVLRVFSILAFSAPVFWIGTIAIIFPAVWWHYFPPLFYVPFQQNPSENLRQFIVPSLVLAFSLSGSVARIVRSSMLEVLRQDYVRTARAKGLRERVIIGRHALRNGFIPVLTFLGLQLAVLLGGTVIIESIFALPGLGSLTLSAVLTKDYPVIQGSVLIFAAIVVLVNLVVDLSYGVLDPRLRGNE